MTLRQPMITAELRQWRRSNNGVTGFIYRDRNEVWDDGEEAFFSITRWEDCSTFWLAHSNTEVYQCDKDEEIKDGSSLA